jgi:predicted nuclease of predicted toxin-antitoxin system
MRFKIDENLHDDVAALLVNAGHDAKTVHDQGIRGCDDAVRSQLCAAEARVIVTLDLDFADIRAFPPAQSAGMIVLRIRDQSRPHILNVLNRALPLINQESLAGRLWIVSEAGVRIRGA